jgi:hypothetical protein
MDGRLGAQLVTLRAAAETTGAAADRHREATEPGAADSR